jgi:peptide/nickel transport system permease protein
MSVSGPQVLPGGVSIESAGALSAGRREVRRELLREIVRSPLFLIGAFVLLVWIVCAIFGSTIAPKDPYAQTLEAINKSPSSAHLFGTDQLGRDVFSRVIVGSRDILIISPLATLLGTVLGTAIGLVMGYFRGIVDDVLSRFVEAFLALPLVVTGVIALSTLGRSNLVLIIVIGLVFTPLIARTVRAAVLLERELDYVAAARLRDERAPYIMFAEILPNVLAPIIVEFTVRLAYAIFTVLTLTFLGLGVQPPSPDWGLDISTNYGVVPAGYWWEVLFDALAIATLVVAVTLISDAIQAVFEER